jgi:phosphatidate phosphatase APP1
MTRPKLPISDSGMSNSLRVVVLFVIALLALLVTLTATARPPAAEDAGREDVDMNWKQQLKDLASRGLFLAEDASDNTRHRLQRRFNVARAQYIAAYSGYANERQLWIRGRLLADPPISAATGEESWWHNFRATLQRWESDEVAAAEIELRHGDERRTVVTDAEGYYAARFDRDAGHDAPLEVEARYTANGTDLSATHRVFAPVRRAQYLIISDMDDTVLHTGITNLWTAARLTFLGNAKTRKPLPGVAGLYRALSAGSNGAVRNPVFYVSNSGWNLYDLLRHFIEINDLPDGPILLRDLGLNDRDRSSRTHKSETIRRILARYPSLPAVLIGDSGQHDAELYADVAESFPGRILAIYIRDVDPGVESPYDAKVDAVFDGFSGAEVPMVRAEDSRAFAEHMQSLGLLPDASSAPVAGSAIRDEQRGRIGR